MTDFVHDKHLHNLFGPENRNKPRSKEQWEKDKKEQHKARGGNKGQEEASEQGKYDTKHWLGEEYLSRLPRSKPKYTLSPEILRPENVDESQLCKWFPSGSVFIEIHFELDKPYTSKSDEVFKVAKSSKEYKFVDNPIVRDTLTNYPMVRPSTWKGNLRFAAQKVIEQDSGPGGADEQMVINRLFGSETVRGRLYFFPTFFSNPTEQYVITPLSRETRTPTGIPTRTPNGTTKRGRGPIQIETVPPGGKGTLYLFYFPYPKGQSYTEKQVDEDIEFLAKAVKEMFYTYGFSAKKTSGFGVTKKLSSDSKHVIVPEKYRDYFSILWSTGSDEGRA